MENGEALVFPYNLDTNLPFMLPIEGRQEQILDHNTEQSCGHGQHTVGLDRSDADLFSSPDELFELMSVADETNQNLSKAQKESLQQWHWKLGHCNFQWVQSLAAESKLNDIKCENEDSLLLTKHRISNIAALLCSACQLAKQSRRGAGTSAEFNKIEDRDMILKRKTTKPGDCVSIDR